MKRRDLIPDLIETVANFCERADAIPYTGIRARDLRQLFRAIAKYTNFSPVKSAATLAFLHRASARNFWASRWHLDTARGEPLASKIAYGPV
jgi:hypothetical protein